MATGIVLHAMAVKARTRGVAASQMLGKAAKQAAAAAMEHEQERMEAQVKHQAGTTSWAGALPAKILAQALLNKLRLRKQPQAKILNNAPLSLSRNRILILEEVHNFFNLGMILKCAEVFRIKEVLCVVQSAAARLHLQSSM
eukprot:gnl/MRDRNA2_/MRDRNA2_310094_c0_seq1.p1 gnl/MRDRNA2_/MRDRNA2_310094_c0~~gnl/MRDRNA2_/MRDRNA2_310094_c0_seq1.p1  ORF type:complete len:160 (-),score=38.82 gnl/MRDRNA2_/MRDRNA2_310094_c0_seq1:37-462(-)